jgi:hypothetical protein
LEDTELTGAADGVTGKITDEETFAVHEMKEQILQTKQKYLSLLESGKIRDEKRIKAFEQAIVGFD